MKLQVLFMLVALVVSSAQAQVLTSQEYLSLVMNNHPIVQQANIRIAQSESIIQGSRGSFDPKLESTISSKFYSGTNYFNVQSNSIKWATPFAAELKAGYDVNTGVYLNPDLKTPNAGLGSLGVSIPVLQGLMMDERRASLKKAELLKTLNEVDRRNVINDILTEAMNAYTQWWSANQRVRITTDMLDLAKNRFEAIRMRALVGERASIDTLESYMQLQQRQIQYNEALVNELKTRYTLSNYAWKKSPDNQSYTPLLIQAEVQPELEVAWLLPSPQHAESWIDNHPIIQGYDIKLKSYRIDERLKREKLKPKLNFDYNLLSSNTGSQYVMSPSNYKYGVQFSLPLFLREARGEVGLIRLKSEELNWQKKQKELELTNKSTNALMSLNVLIEQEEISRLYVDNCATLMSAENTKLNQGESSLFLVNQREIAWLEARSKLIDIQNKRLVMTLDYYAAQGRVSDLMP